MWICTLHHAFWARFGWVRVPDAIPTHSATQDTRAIFYVRLRSTTGAAEVTQLSRDLGKFSKRYSTLSKNSNTFSFASRKTRFRPSRRCWQ